MTMLFAVLLTVAHAGDTLATLTADYPVVAPSPVAVAPGLVETTRPRGGAVGLHEEVVPHLWVGGELLGASSTEMLLGGGGLRVDGQLGDRWFGSAGALVGGASVMLSSGPGVQTGAHYSGGGFLLAPRVMGGFQGQRVGAGLGVEHRMVRGEPSVGGLDHTVVSLTLRTPLGG